MYVYIQGYDLIRKKFLILKTKENIEKRPDPSIYSLSAVRKAARHEVRGEENTQSTPNYTYNTAIGVQ